MDKIKEFIPKAKEKGYEILLLGGPNETGVLDNLKQEMSSKGIKVYGKNTYSSLQDFFALINICDKVVCADTMALHIALALNKQVVALFFCNSPWEIEGYSLVKKLISPMLKDFFPEKMDKYSEELVKSISADEVADSI